MKCFAPHYIGDFKLKGSDLRTQGINRLGNLLVPNSNYCHFEEFVCPLLEKMTDEQVGDLNHIIYLLNLVLFEHLLIIISDHLFLNIKK